MPIIDFVTNFVTVAPGTAILIAVLLVQFMRRRVSRHA
jgi:hypothetical protein